VAVGEDLYDKTGQLGRL